MRRDKTLLVASYVHFGVARRGKTLLVTPNMHIDVDVLRTPAHCIFLVQRKEEIHAFTIFGALPHIKYKVFYFSSLFFAFTPSALLISTLTPFASLDTLSLLKKFCSKDVHSKKSHIRHLKCEKAVKSCDK